MKLYSWNVNGIRAVEKKGFTDWVIETQPDVLGLQEVKADESQLSDGLLNLEGYKSFFHSAERKGYSGTAVYYKREPLSITTGLSDPQFNSEGRTIIMEYPEFTFYNIYFPNGQKDEERLQFKMDFYECFLKDVNALVAQGKRVIVCGDVNTAHREIDLKNPKSNAKRSGFLPIERQWVDQFLADGYIDVKALRLTLTQASWRVAEGLPAEVDVNTAAFWAAEAGHRVAHTAVHVHGGVGIDMDHPVHRYFLAAKQTEFAVGGATGQLLQIGRELAETPV